MIGRNSVSTRLPNDSLPPVISWGQFTNFLLVLEKQQPSRIDKPWILKTKATSPGNTGPLLGALKWLGIIDKSYRVINPKILARLGNPQERSGAFRELVNQHYTPLLSLLMRAGHEQVTIEDVENYLEVQGIKKSNTNKAARFFVLLAQGAGYNVGLQMNASPIRFTASSSQSTEKDIDDAEDEDEAEYQDEVDIDLINTKKRVLNVLVAKLENSKETDPELLKYIFELIRGSETNLSNNL
jgi:hypothetical protein